MPQQAKIHAKRRKDKTDLRQAGAAGGTHTHRHTHTQTHTHTHARTHAHIHTHSPLPFKVCWSRVRQQRDSSASLLRCCSVLQCVAVCCSVLQCVAVCCSVLQCVAVIASLLRFWSGLRQRLSMVPLHTRKRKEIYKYTLKGLHT